MAECKMTLSLDTKAIQNQLSELTRPIDGIEYRTPQEVFDIMCCRFVELLVGEEPDNGRLKPCPICGSAAVVREGRLSSFYVQCTECGCRLPDFPSTSDHKAVDSWNNRAGKIEVLA